VALRSATLNVMMKAARQAGVRLKRDYGEVDQLQVSRKGPADFVSMAACVGRYDQWKTFDQQWNAALAKHNAPYLHMREYAHSIGPFEGWKEPQRRGLMADCLGACPSNRL